MHKLRKNLVAGRCGSKGMSLVELMVVMGIFAVVMLAVTSLYVPTYQSTVTQTQVADVQSGLRLALRTMTRDLLMGGFLMPYDPIAFPDASPNYNGVHLDSPGNVNSADFIIRTRIVGNDFARIQRGDMSGSDLVVVVADPDMIDNFPDGSKVRIFEPITASEFKDDTGSPAQRVYEVDGYWGTAPNYNGVILNPGISISNPEAQSLSEGVMVRISDASQPPLQTIRYRLVDGELRRQVNSAMQILARNVDTSDTSLGGTSYFDYDFTSEGRVRSVEIKLTGKTESQDKLRAVETTVKLRNIN